MRPRRTTLATWLVVGLLAGACGGGDDVAGTAGTPDATTATDAPASTTPATTSPATTAVEEPAGGDVTVATAGTDLGEVLVDGAGMTLYLFDRDTDGTSECYDSCAETWPPLLGTAAAGDGADAALLGTTERTDGTTQVTYAGQPLYLYAADQAPGDVNGQAVGGVWWVVAPDGTKVTDEAAAASTDGY